MKQQSDSVYDTYSTETAAALLALGCDLIKKDPIRRIFDEGHPINNRVSHGIHRGGRCRYYLNGDYCEEFNASPAELAQAFWDKRPDTTAEELVSQLKETLRGSEAGGIFERFMAELPKEICRFIRKGFEERRNLINHINENSKIVEMVRVNKGGGEFLEYNAKMSKEDVEELAGAIEKLSNQ